MSDNFNGDEYEVAIIGMAGRFPKAKNIEEYWNNLMEGKECVTFFSEEELRETGIDDLTLHDSSYVKARPYIEDIECFDAEFFKVNSREATIMDPQHRLFMQVAWESLEDAGYIPTNYDGKIGIFAGCDTNTYLLNNVILSEPDIVREDPLAIKMEDKDYLCTRTAYRLNLTGPSVMTQSACSSATIAVHLASESILSGECDMALAGAVSLTLPVKSGYFYREGGVVSQDGHVRVFDSQSSGTVYGDGLGVVVLKRLSDAIEDKDHIYAVIKGVASNNDGGDRIGFTAPSLQGQADVIQGALDAAGVEPDSIGYIETHGTGTKLGDSIEIAALIEAYKEGTREEGTCPIGSVKPNIGHTSTASGMASLIKVALALEKEIIPPTIHYQETNPEINFSNTPFYVNTKVKEWRREGSPRRAALSAFGLGGSNTHMILEEAPMRIVAKETKRSHVFMLSAKNEEVLKEYELRLANYIKKNTEAGFEDIAHTLQKGRMQFSCRCAVVAKNTDELIKGLYTKSTNYVNGNKQGAKHYVLMFPGIGEEYEGIIRGLYESITPFRKYLDCCHEIIQKQLDWDMYSFLFSERSSEQKVLNIKEERKLEFKYAYVMVFSIEYSIAKLLEEFGVIADIYIGYSIGEYVAACLSEVFDLEDAISLLYSRGALIDELPEGAMLSVMLPHSDVEKILGNNLSLAAIEAPHISVVSGECDAIMNLEREFKAQGIAAKRVPTDRAFHSYQMNSTVSKFKKIVEGVRRNPPKKRFISNITGNFITDEEAMSADYWSRHLILPVQFSAGVQTLLEEDAIWIEAGAGNSLSVFAMQHSARLRGKTVQTIRTYYNKTADDDYFLMALAKLWCCGANIHWKIWNDRQKYNKVPLPTYPFQKNKYWMEPAQNYFLHMTSGKNNNQANEKIDLEREGIKTDYVEAGSNTQKEILKIWESVLGIQRIGMEDNFFELGGNSLLAVKILYSIKKEFSVDISMEVFYNNPIIGYLAEYVDTLQLYKGSEIKKQVDSKEWVEIEL